MLDPSEVVNGKGNLAVDSPHHGSVHGSTEDLVVNWLTVFSEGLGNGGVRSEEEDDHGTDKPIAHPAKYAGPTEEDVLYSLLIQHRILQNKIKSTIIHQNDNNNNNNNNSRNMKVGSMNGISCLKVKERRWETVDRSKRDKQLKFGHA